MGRWHHRRLLVLLVLLRLLLLLLRLLLHLLGRGRRYTLEAVLSDVPVEVVEALGVLARSRAGREGAGERLLVEQRVVGAHEAVLHHGHLAVGHQDGVAHVEDLAGVRHVGVVAQRAVGAAEVDVDGPVHDVVGARREAQVGRLRRFADPPAVIAGLRGSY